MSTKNLISAVYREQLIAAKRQLLKKKQIEVYKRYPLAWLKDKLGEEADQFEWSKIPGYENHSWDGDVDPLSNAWKSLAQNRWVGIEAATGTSKTFFLARVILWFLDCFENSLVVTSAPKQDQLKLNLWSEVGRILHKFKKVRPDAALYTLRLVVDEQIAEEMTEDEIYSSNTWHAVGFVAGVGAEEDSANRARGFHRKDMLLILEECPGMPLAVMTAFQNTCTGEHNLMLAVGNPDNEFDPLHQFCEQANVANYRISAYDYPNVVLNKELFPGAVTNASIERRKDVYGESSPLYSAMVRGISPQQSKDSLIRSEWFEQCVGLEDDEYISMSYNAAGVDVANSEDGDKASVAYGRGAVLEEIYEFHCNNATHLAYNLLYQEGYLNSRGYEVYNIPTVSDYDINWGCVGVDAVGVGIATVNAMVDEGFDVVSLQGGQWEEVIPLDEKLEKPLYKFQNLRAQMYWELREDFRRKRISVKLKDVSILAAVKKELLTTRFNVKSSNLAIESKEDIKKRLGGKSPNRADAIAYWNWARKGYRLGTGALPLLGVG